MVSCGMYQGRWQRIQLTAGDLKGATYKWRGEWVEINVAGHTRHVVGTLGMMTGLE